MRSLFVSERRCISNLFEMKWEGTVGSGVRVFEEAIAQPAAPTQTPWFNCDFILDFVDHGSFKSERSAVASSVPPNALGAGLFLIVEKTTLLPTALELNGGPAFPITHYASFIDVVETVLQQAIEQGRRRKTEHASKDVVEIIPIGKAGFARFLVIGSDATFLYFPSETTPLMRGERVRLALADDREIDCYVDGHQIVCFDGWVRTKVASTDRTLVASPEDIG